VRLLYVSWERRPIGILAYCVMPNHFHLVLQPVADGDLSPWMQWLTTSHVRRHHRRYGSTGHLWQGRYKSFPVATDRYLLAVLRYVEGNPLRAGLVHRAEEWPWSSLRWWASPHRPAFLSEGPLDRGQDWPARVNQPDEERQLAALRHAVVRGCPLGPPAWRTQIASLLGLESTLRPRGRPPR